MLFVTRGQVGRLCELVAKKKASMYSSLNLLYYVAESLYRCLIVLRIEKSNV